MTIIPDVSLPRILSSVIRILSYELVLLKTTPEALLKEEVESMWTFFERPGVFVAYNNVIVVLTILKKRVRLY